jgi:hypothetical protein
VNDPHDDEKLEQAIPTVKLHGVVDKIVPPVSANGPGKAQIVIQEAEELYKEIRIDNAFENGDGETVKLKHGTEVDVIVEAPIDSVDKSGQGLSGNKSED